MSRKTSLAISKDGSEETESNRRESEQQKEKPISALPRAVANGNRPRSKRSAPGSYQGARSAAIAKRGIRSSRDVRDLMCAIMSDAILGALPVAVGNTACRAGDVAIRTFELEQIYGNGDHGRKTFALASSAIKRNG